MGTTFGTQVQNPKMRFVFYFLNPTVRSYNMNKQHLSKKTLISWVALSILVVGIAHYSQSFVHPISAKKGTSEVISNSDSATASGAINNSTIMLNALELKNETYRWQNTSEGINPTLHLIAGTSYLFKIKNPTDGKHELIIGLNGTEIAKSNHIDPGKNRNFVFNANSSGVFEYHCEYHPDSMKGVIEISNQ